jgi:hypothetical protein
MIPESARLRVMLARSPEERFAAAVIDFENKFYIQHSRPADFADLRDGLKPYILRELALARMDEVKRFRPETMEQRKSELALAILAIEEELGWGNNAT